MSVEECFDPNRMNTPGRRAALDRAKERATTTTVRKSCFVAWCAEDALPRDKFCAVHLNQANAWLTEQSRLDGAEEGRRMVEQSPAHNGWDPRASVGDELAVVGWDDPDDVAEQE